MTRGAIPSERPALVRYGAAVVAVGLSIILGIWLEPHTYTTPFLTFYAACIFAAWFGGFRPGLLATILAALSANYFFLLPHPHQLNFDIPSVFQTLIFIAIFGVVSWLAEQVSTRLYSTIDLQSQLLELSFDPVIVRDSEDRVIYWNQGAERLYGFTKDEAHGRVTHDLLRTVHLRPLDQIRAELNQTGHWHGELLHTRKDGSTVAVESWWTLQKEGDRQSAVLESNYDLTERRKAEQSLRYLSAIVESSDAAIIGKTLDGIVTAWNSGAERLYGYTAAEMIGQPISLLKRADQPNEFPTILKRLAHGEFIEAYDTVRCHKDGTVIDVALKVSPIFDNTGKIIGASSIARDIRERKQAEREVEHLNQTLRVRNAELEAERARWKGVVEGIADEVWVCDAHGRMSLLNLPNVTHMELPEFRDKSIQQVLEEVDIMYPDGQIRPPEQAPLLRSLRGEVCRGEEVMRHRRTGKTRWRQFSCAPTRDATGAITGAVAIVRDVTEHKQIEEALRRSEARLRAAALAADVGVWYWNPGTSYVEVSANWRNLFGIAPDVEVTFETWRNAIHPDDRERAVREINAASEQQREFNTEYRILRPDGSMRWIVDRGRAFYDKKGRALSMAGINVDITERKRAEEALHSSEQRVRHLLDSLFVFVGVLELDGTLIEANRAALVAGGITAEDVIGKKFWDCPWWNYDPDVQAQLRRAIECARSAEMVRYDVPVRMAGGLIVIDFALTPMRDHEGNITHLIPSGVDISERKRAEQALRDSEQQFRTLADSIPQLAWMANPDGWIFWYNRRWYEYTGTTPEMMQGWGWQSVHDPAELPKVLERWQSSLQTGNTFDMVFPLRGADGVFRPFLTRVLPLRDESGSIVRWFGTNTDIHAQKQAEQALVKHEKLASVGRMAATIAHEINNPLAAAMNALYLISSDAGLPDNVRPSLQLAEHELERVAHITKQTLGFYREAGSGVKVQLSELIDGILSLFAPKLKNASLRVERQYAASATAFGIEGEIRQIISNLIANSIDAMPQNGTLYVRTSGPVSFNSSRPMVQLTIADTGAGISPESAPRIFEPFFTTKAAIGTGLGLWVTKELVTKHEGKIRVRSRVGKGTVFTIWLPSERRHNERVGSAGAA